MTRPRMHWREIHGRLYFVYTWFLDHNKFSVKIVQGKVNDKTVIYNQNVIENEKAFIKYTSRGLPAHYQVANEAFEIVKDKLNAPVWKFKNTRETIICPFCNSHIKPGLMWELRMKTPMGYNHIAFYPSFKEANQQGRSYAINFKRTMLVRRKINV